MGPLNGFVVIELAGIGPAPFAGMMLADMGATVIRVDRREAADLGLPGRSPKFDVLGRGRQTVAVDLKSAEGIGIVKRLVAKADALIEGFRPGVIERLGLGPEVLLALNPKLVIGRMTGFGQSGPMADRAGHDINYISLTGALHAIGRKGQAPVPPLNLVGDFGGGGMLLAFGVVAALLETSRSGKGQVVDAAMVDGAAYLMGIIFGLRSAGQWQDERGVNILDTGAPWYDVYETADGKYMAVGAIEARFYQEFLLGLGFAGADLPEQHDRKRWPELREKFTVIFKTKSRDAWAAVFADKDACVTPVLSLDEAPVDSHMGARKVFQTVDGVTAPMPAPRFSRTAAVVGGVAHAPGADTDAVLANFGFSAAEIKDLSARGVVGRPAA
jgi:alpha-methylacyl-CoA racemase